MGEQMILYTVKGHENKVRKLPVPQVTRDFFTHLATISFSRRIVLHGTNYW